MLGGAWSRLGIPLNRLRGKSAKVLMGSYFTTKLNYGQGGTCKLDLQKRNYEI